MSKRIRLFEEDEDFLVAQHCKGNLRKTTPQLVARIVYIPLLCGRKFHGTLMKFDMLRRERRNAERQWRLSKLDSDLVTLKFKRISSKISPRMMAFHHDCMPQLGEYFVTKTDTV